MHDRDHPERGAAPLDRLERAEMAGLLARPGAAGPEVIRIDLARDGRRPRYCRINLAPAEALTLRDRLTELLLRPGPAQDPAPMAPDRSPGPPA